MLEIFAISFTVTVTLILVLRPLAAVIGLVDRPGGRKLHLGEVPLTGGLAMTAGILASGFVTPQPFSGYSYFAASVCLLAIVGALDDRFDVPKSVRVATQTVAALMLVYGGDLCVRDLGSPFLGGTVELGRFSAVFTVVIVLTAINALNIFDGSNGIAGGQALVALLLFWGAAAMAGNVALMALIVGLSACVVGFLVFNWPARATLSRRAFMGDAGSTVLGFSLAWLSIALSQGEPKLFSPVCALWIFALPIYDLFSSMLRRIANGRSPFAADADHLHHVLRRYFGTSVAVACIIVTAAAVLGFLALYAHFNGVQDGQLFIAWLLTGGLYHTVFGSGLLVKRRSVPRSTVQAAAQKAISGSQTSPVSGGSVT